MYSKSRSFYSACVQSVSCLLHIHFCFFDLVSVIMLLFDFSGKKNWFLKTENIFNDFPKSCTHRPLLICLTKLKYDNIRKLVSSQILCCTVIQVYKFSCSHGNTFHFNKIIWEIKRVGVSIYYNASHTIRIGTNSSCTFCNLWRASSLIGCLTVWIVK